jgi:hypothetical protein
LFFAFKALAASGKLTNPKQLGEAPRVVNTFAALTTPNSINNA